MRRPKPQRASIVERGAQRIANARSVAVGLAATYVALALLGAVVMRFADPHNFPTFGLAVWWVLQTVTTVGYGDVVPTSDVGRVIGGIEMVIGVSFIAVLTASVTSAVIQRTHAAGVEEETAEAAQDLQSVVDALAQLKHATLDVDKRLEAVEAKLEPRCRK